VNYLPQILKQKFPDSTSDFSDVIKAWLNFKEFIKLFLSVTEKNYDYLTFKFNKETKNILISHKSIDEINSIIISTSNGKKEKLKMKDKKSKILKLILKIKYQIDKQKIAKVVKKKNLKIIMTYMKKKQEKIFNI